MSLKQNTRMVESVGIDSVSYKVACFKHAIVKMFWNLRNLTWGWVNSIIFYLQKAKKYSEERKYPLISEYLLKPETHKKHNPKTLLMIHF